MNVKVFYQKVRELEAAITADYVVVASLATLDGGKAGVKSEVSRHAAARLIADSKATLATPEEAEEYYRIRNEERARAEQVAISNQFHVALVSDIERGSVRIAPKPTKRS